jgi:hypothetical protein
MVLAPEGELRRLKRVDKRYRSLLAYVRHLEDIRKARREVRTRRAIYQEQLSRSLGI